MVLFFLIFFASLVYFAKFFTMIEIDFVKDFYKIENTKYIVLLRILETMTPFVTLVIEVDLEQYLNQYSQFFVSYVFHIL